MDEKSERAQKEEKILQFWKENQIFEKTLLKDAPKGEFVFYDGPPFATGLPHYGHILPGTIKDVIPRYKTMTGYRVPRNWGWDCHGLPIENLIEKELGLETKKDIEKYGIAEFNKRARESVLRYEKDWKEIIPRTGRWVDMENSYKTMDRSYTESVWWSFHKLFQEGLVYQGFKSMHLCPRCETTLSNFEVNQGYKDIVDLSVYVKFESLDEPGTYFLAWTTTPWTLPGNVALAINPDIEYVKVRYPFSAKIKAENVPPSQEEVAHGQENYFILAKSLFEKVFGTSTAEVVETYGGKKLIGQRYKTLFEYYLKESKIYGANFVKAEEGTGIVHIAPAFGEEDYELSLREKLPFIQHVGTDGRFKPEVTDFVGRQVKPKDDHQSTDVEIIRYLAAKNLLFAKEKVTHSYPHCWRCDTPLLNYASSSWFVRVTEIRDRILNSNNKVNWVPEEIKEGRFGKWLEGARDWAVSRSRYWGTPLPVWENSDKSKRIVVDSLETLKKYSRKANNSYLVMRHGESTHNLEWKISTYKENKDELTEKGRNEVLESARKLKNENIDLLIISPFLRTRQTAEIMVKELSIKPGAVKIEEDLHEFAVHSFEGKTWKEYHEAFPKTKEFFDQKREGDESYSDVRSRVMKVIEKYEREYQGKKILFVTHGGPAWIMTAAAEFLTLDEVYEMISKHNNDRLDDLKNAAYREVNYMPLPHNNNLELDLHRPYIDEVVLAKDGEEYRRVPEVFDTWYDSGSVPFASRGAKDFRPADFIAEGLDQTRGWFYTMAVLSTALFGDFPYKRVVVNGLVLAEDGKKMSKRLKNYPELTEVLNKYGADALRYYLLASQAVRAEDIAFSEKGLDEVMKKNISRLENVVGFYELYAKEDGVTSNEHVLDRWIDARFQELLKTVTEGLESYELDRASRPFTDFIDDLSTWYLRRSRTRPEALPKLRILLIELSKIMAPFMPFMAEDIYQRLRVDGDKQSVHLEAWPEEKKHFLDNFRSRKADPILKEMKKVREIVSLALEARSKANVKVRQPLLKLELKTALPSEYLGIIREELNVKGIVITPDLAEAVSLDTHLTPELIEEGKVRDALRAIQEWRKEQGLKPGEKAHFPVPEEEREFYQKHKEELQKAAAVEF